MAKKSSAILEKLDGLFKNFMVNATKYNEKGVKAAAQRARKVSSEINRLLKEYRKLTIEETR